MDVHKLATEINDLGPLSFKKTSAAARARRAANEIFSAYFLSKQLAPPTMYVKLDSRSWSRLSVALALCCHYPGVAWARYAIVWMDRATPRIEVLNSVIEVKQYAWEARAFAVRSHGRHLHVGSPRSSLVGLVPWRFSLRYGGTSTRMHARVSVTRYVELRALDNSCYAQEHDIHVQVS